IIAMREAGMLAPGKKPTAKDFERYAAYQTAQSAMLKGAMLTKDLSALEELGGIGGFVTAVLTDPKAKATQKAVAIQSAVAIYKLAPTIIGKGIEPDNIVTFSDEELDEVAGELGGDE
ncbi:hypothetical protein, partial [Klebsiella pneumoniae]|uniref:hypothetical protein n=1 Tax=Klebsiella pneumoniae TaxID=573 RepID=UPI001C626DB7